MTRAALILASLIGLSACDSGAGLALAGAGLATVVHTQKTPADHALSWAMDENCSILHSANNEPYCQPLPPDPRERLADMSASLFCYRTLGNVTCYKRPDQSASSQTRINYAHGYAPAEEATPVAALPWDATY